MRRQKQLRRSRSGLQKKAKTSKKTTTAAFGKAASGERKEAEKPAKKMTLKEQLEQKVREEEHL